MSQIEEELGLFISWQKCVLSCMNRSLARLREY
jgi:hypothetical protein